ncbi:MAG TPA: CHRD domain-containing protein [Chitinophagaceae bacterium]|nr:CHRD domain-containing protein [Chitinophagaceae bacterium]
MKRFFAILAVSYFLFGFTSRDQSIGGRPLYATMSGSQEAPVPGDPDATGWAVFYLNQGQGTISYEIHVENIESPVAAHIHIAPAGVPGPIVVPLHPPVGGMSMGVADVDPELIKAIRQNPGSYYVNVHNASFRGGACRGQLTK